MGENEVKSVSKITDFFIGLGLGLLNVGIAIFLTVISIIWVDELNLDDISYILVGFGIPIIFIVFSIFLIYKFFNIDRKVIGWGFLTILILPIILIILILIIAFSGGFYS